MLSPWHTMLISLGIKPMLFPMENFIIGFTWGQTCCYYSPATQHTHTNTLTAMIGVNTVTQRVASLSDYDMSAGRSLSDI